METVENKDEEVVVEAGNSKLAVSIKNNKSKIFTYLQWVPYIWPILSWIELKQNREKLSLKRKGLKIVYVASSSAFYILMTDPQNIDLTQWALLQVLSRGSSSLDIHVMRQEEKKST